MTVMNEAVDLDRRWDVALLAIELVERWRRCDRMAIDLSDSCAHCARQAQRWALEDNQRIAQLVGVDLVDPWHLDGRLTDEELPHWDCLRDLVDLHLQTLPVETMATSVRGLPAGVLVLVAPGQDLTDLGVTDPDVFGIRDVAGVMDWVDVRLWPSTESTWVADQRHTVLALEIEVIGMG